VLIADPILADETAELLARYETEPEHTRHVARLALQLFDQLQEWHRLGARDRDLLACAALLHDVGWSESQPDGTGHHKASARLIRAHAWRGLSAAEKECVAEVARYHRKSLPDIAVHPTYARLGEVDRRRAGYLAAFLRIADGLDRRHVQRVQSVTAAFGPTGLTIVARAAAEVEIELEAADRKADLLRCFVLAGPFFRAELETGGSRGSG